MTVKIKKELFERLWNHPGQWVDDKAILEFVYENMSYVEQLSPKQPDLKAFDVSVLGSWDTFAEWLSSLSRDYSNELINLDDVLEFCGDVEDPFECNPATVFPDTAHLLEEISNTIITKLDRSGEYEFAVLKLSVDKRQVSLFLSDSDGWVLGYGDNVRLEKCVSDGSQHTDGH